MSIRNLFKKPAANKTAPSKTVNKKTTKTTPVVPAGRANAASRISLTTGSTAKTTTTKPATTTKSTTASKTTTTKPATNIMAKPAPRALPSAKDLLNSITAPYKQAVSRFSNQAPITSRSQLNNRTVQTQRDARAGAYQNAKTLNYTGGANASNITATRGGKVYNFQTDKGTAQQRDAVIGTTGRLAQNMIFNNPINNVPLHGATGAYRGMQDARAQGKNPLLGGLQGAAASLKDYGKNLFTKGGYEYDSEIEAVMNARGKDKQGARDGWDVALGLGAGILSPSITDFKALGKGVQKGASALSGGNLKLGNSLNLGAMSKSEFLENMLKSQQAKAVANADMGTAKAATVKTTGSKASVKNMIKAELGSRVDDLGKMSPPARAQAIQEIVKKYTVDPTEIQKHTEGFLQAANKKFVATPQDLMTQAKKSNVVPFKANPSGQMTMDLSQYGLKNFDDMASQATKQADNLAPMGQQAMRQVDGQIGMDFSQLGKQAENVATPAKQIGFNTNPSGQMTMDLSQYGMRNLDEISPVAKQAMPQVMPSPAGQMSMDFSQVGRQAGNLAPMGQQAMRQADALGAATEANSIDDLARQSASMLNGADDVAETAVKRGLTKKQILGGAAVGGLGTMGLLGYIGGQEGSDELNYDADYTGAVENAVAAHQARQTGSGSGSPSVGGSAGAPMQSSPVSSGGGFDSPYSQQEMDAFMANQDMYKQMIEQAMGQPNMVNDMMNMFNQPAGNTLGQFADLLSQLGIDPNMPTGQLGEMLTQQPNMMPDQFMDYDQWSESFQQVGGALDSGQMDLQGAVEYIKSQMQPQFDQSMKAIQQNYDMRLNQLREDLAARGLLNSGIYDQAVMLLNQDLSASLVSLQAEHNAQVLQMGMQYWGDNQDRAMQLRQMYMQEKQVAVENYYKQQQLQMQIGQINTENMQRAKDRQYEISMTLLRSELEKQMMMMEYGFKGYNASQELYLKGLNKAVPNVYNSNRNTNTNVNMNYN